MVTVMVNGNAGTLPEGGTVVDVVRETTGEDAPRGVAVAVNGAVVPRTAWAATGLADGDRVEVLAATAGG
jgi:sulfur carrier protein